MKTVPNLKTVSLALLILVIFLFGTALRIKYLGSVEMRSPDETVYTLQARTLATEGSRSISSMIKEWNSNWQAWLYPPPVRIGYIWLLSSLMKILGNGGLYIGAYISCASSILSLLLLVVLGLRFFNPWITSAALLLLSVSPIDLAIARRTWQDSLIGFIGCSLIYLCAEIGRNPRRTSLYILFAALGAYGILVKETGIIIFGLCTAWLVWILFAENKDHLRGAIAMALVVLGLIVSASILVHASGGIGQLLEVYNNWKHSVQANFYNIEYQSGPWYSFLEGFWIISPAGSILCVVGILGAWKKRASAGIALIGMAFLLIVMLTPYSKSMRYVSVIFVPFYLMAGAGFWQLITAAKMRFGAALFYAATCILSLALIFGAWHDINTFKKAFVRTGILDTSIRMIKEASRQ